MPIYEYECGACGARHEFIQKFSDGAKRKCPACGANRLRRLVSAAAFHLKGSGWYVTDFRDKDNKKGDGKEAKSGNADSAKTGTGKSSEKSSDKSPKSDSSGKSSVSKSAD